MKVLEKLKLWTSHLMRAGHMWWRHKHADEAAALAFYSLISLVPILLVGIFIASIFVDEKTATDILLAETHRVAGSSVGTYFAQILQSDVRSVDAGASPMIGLFFLFYSATKMIAELRKSLGKVFGVPRRKGRKAAFAGVIGRLASLAMLLILGVFIASAVIFETMAALFLNSVDNYSWVMKVATGLAPVLSFCGMTLLSAVAMRWLPVRPPHFKEALIGGAVSAALLLLLKIGLAKFLAYSQFGSIYGSAMTLVLVLFWIYFAMQVFLFGAELAAVLAQQRRNAEDAAQAAVTDVLEEARKAERMLESADETN